MQRENEDVKRAQLTQVFLKCALISPGRVTYNTSCKLSPVGAKAKLTSVAGTEIRNYVHCHMNVFEACMLKQDCNAMLAFFIGLIHHNSNDSHYVQLSDVPAHSY